MTTFSPKDYLDIADAYGLQLEKPFDFMNSRLEDFTNRNDKLREMFVENKRVPERLSETNYNNRLNEFKLQNLNDNWNLKIDNTRLGLESGNSNYRKTILDNQYYFDNIDEIRKTEKLERDYSAASKQNVIRKEAARRDYEQYKLANPIDAQGSFEEYFDNFYSQANNFEYKNLVDTDLMESVKPTLNNFDIFRENLTKWMSTVSDINSSDEPSATLKSRVNQYKSSVSSAISNIDFEQMAYLNKRGLLKSNQYQLLEQAAMIAKALNLNPNGIELFENLNTNSFVENEVIEKNETPLTKGPIEELEQFNADIGFGADVPAMPNYQVAELSPIDEVDSKPAIIETPEQEVVSVIKEKNSFDKLPDELKSIFSSNIKNTELSSTIDRIEQILEDYPEYRANEYIKNRLVELNSQKEVYETIIETNKSTNDANMWNSFNSNPKLFYDFIESKNGRITGNTELDELLLTDINDFRKVISSINPNNIYDYASKLKTFKSFISFGFVDKKEKLSSVIEDINLKLNIMDQFINNIDNY